MAEKITNPKIGRVRRPAPVSEPVAGVERSRIADLDARQVFVPSESIPAWRPVGRHAESVAVVESRSVAVDTDVEV